MEDQPSATDICIRDMASRVVEDMSCIASPATPWSSSTTGVAVMSNAIAFGIDDGTAADPRAEAADCTVDRLSSIPTARPSAVKPPISAVTRLGE